MRIFVEWLKIYQISYKESTVWIILRNNIQVKYSGLHESGILNSVKHSKFNLLKPTGHVMHQQFNIQQLSAHTVFMCFVFIWEQTAACATYSINWLVL